MTHDTREDIPVTTSPFAVVVHGHVALARMHDPAAPIFVDTRDVRRAGEVTHLDTRCQHCDSRQAIQRDLWSVLVVTGHADGCAWYAGALADAIERDGPGIAAFTAGLAVTGAPA